MDTKYGDGADDVPEGWAKFRAWVAHHYAGIYVASVLILFLSSLTSSMLGVSYWITGPINVAAYISIFWSMGRTTRHSLNTDCDRCIWERLTEDGASEALDNQHHLRRFHRFYEHPFLYLMAFFVLYLTFTVAIPDPLHPFVTLAFYSVLYYESIHMTKKHFRYMQWCPWCRDDGDDDEFEVPEPDPDPTGEEIPDLPKRIVLG